MCAAIKTLILNAKDKLHYIEEEFRGEPDAKLKKQDAQVCSQLRNSMEPHASAEVTLATAYSMISSVSDTFASNDNNCAMNFHDEGK